MPESFTKGPDDRLLDAIRAYYEARDQDHAVDSTAILERFPDVIDGLHEFLSGVECVDRLLSPPVPGRVGGTDGAMPSEVGDYELQGELGSGGMGIVYRAYHRATHRHVALKMMRWERRSDSELVRRFQIEVQAVAALDHPHIVPIYNVGEHDGRPFFTMKLLEGEPLSRRLDAYQRDPRGAARIVHSIARALDEAHARGILHRDVKPHNILLDAAGQPYLTDFGLAKFRDGNLELTSSVATFGSPQYAAPEQARGESRNVTTAADVYGLGATLYALLTGRPPFESDSLFDLLHQIQVVDPAAPRRLNPAVPPDLEVICLKCLRKDRSERYPGAGELADDLHAFLEGRPIHARPPRTLARLRLWYRRNRTLGTLSALLAAALAAGAATSTYFWNVAEVRLAGMTVEKDRAEDSYRLSREALDRSVKLVIDDPRLRSGPLEKLRLDVMGAQLQFHEQFVQRHGGDPRFTGDLANSHLTMGHLANEMGEVDRAQQHFEQALAIYERISHEPDGLQRFGKQLATCWNQVACLRHAQQSGEDVEAAYLHARGILEQVVAAAPHDREAALYLSETLKNLGNLRRGSGRTAEAIELHQRAVDEARRAAGSKWSPWAESTLALSLNELGFSHERCIQWNVPGLPHWEQAHSAYQEAGTLFGELLRSDPEHVEWLTGLAWSHLNRASISGSLHPSAAETDWREGLAVWKRLAKSHPEVPGYNQRLAESLGYFAEFLERQERHADAEREYASALKLVCDKSGRAPDDPQLQQIVGHALHGLGRIEHQRGDSAAAIMHLSRAQEIGAQQALRAPAASSPLESLLRIDQSLAAAYAAAGRRDEALIASERTVEHGKKLCDLAPGNAQYLQILARQHDLLAEALAAAGRCAEAETHYRASLALFAHSPDVPRLWESQRVAARLAGLYRVRNRPFDAERALRDRLRFCREWSELQPDNNDSRYWLRVAAAELGECLESSGFRDEAARLRSESLTLLRSERRALGQSLPGDLEAARDHAERAELERLAGRNEQVLRHCDEARDRLSHGKAQQLDHPALLELTSALAVLEARALSALARHAEAIPCWDDALAACEEAPAGLVIGRARDLALGGRLKESAASIAALEQRSNLTAGECRMAAGVLAACARRGPADRAIVLEDQALKLLHQAVERGFRNPDDLDRDGELEGLRQRRDFDALMVLVRGGAAPVVPVAR